MQSFPEQLSDSSTFSETLDSFLICKMRQEIYLHILRNNQNDFFDIELFNRQHVKDMKKTEQFAETITDELLKLGWKTFVGYGGTGLFFYDKKKPTSAW
jgi:hypothetical protein